MASIIAAILLTVNVFMVNFTIALEPEEDIPSPIVPIDPICGSLISELMLCFPLRLF